MALATWQATVQDDAGDVIVSPVVTVRENNESGDPAELFDVDGNPIANPVTGTVTGFVQFAAAQGLYWVQAASGGNLTEPWYWDAVPFDVEPLTNAEVKTAYESNANTNAFTDAEKTKLAGIEAGADVNPTDAEIAASYASVVPQVSGAERTAGTETAVRRFSPEDVAVMAGLHGGGGGSGGSMSFASRADAVTWIAANAPADGFMVHWPDASVVADASSSVIPDMTGFKPPMNVWTPQHFGDIGGTADSATIQAMWDASTNGQVFFFPPDIVYAIDAEIDANMDYRTVYARGARFVSVTDGASSADPFVMFDFNTAADPANVQSTTKSYGLWQGGEFRHTTPNPTGVAAMRIFAFRQAFVRDCVFGLTGNVYLTSGIIMGGLGSHNIENNRFNWVGVGIDGPDWSAGNTSASVSLTTCSFIHNNFILTGSQKAMYFRGGWEAFKIITGFLNGSTGAAMHFTNFLRAKNLLIEGFRFEQAELGGKHLYIEDTHSNVVSEVNLVSCVFEGNPVGAGTHVNIDLERCHRIALRSVTTGAAQNEGNWGLRLDSNCDGLVTDIGCRFNDPDLNPGASISIPGSVDRGRLFFPSIKAFSPTPLTGFNENSFSTSSQTLDMSSLLSGKGYPTTGVPPKGYTITVSAHDSGSSGTANRRVEFGPSGSTSVTQRPTLSLNGMPDDARACSTFYVQASSAGDIYMNVLASGTGTMGITLVVNEIHN